MTAKDILEAFKSFAPVKANQSIPHKSLLLYSNTLSAHTLTREKLYLILQWEAGSTGVACVNTGRKFIGMELDPVYFEVAKRRIEEAQAQARLAWNTRAPILSAEEMGMLL